MITYLTVLNNLVEYYSTNPSRRAFLTNDLSSYKKYVYLDLHTNNKCAVGMCIDFNKFTPDMENLSINDIIKSLGINIMKKEYMHLTNVSFWCDLQYLHDQDLFWDNNGITPKGKKFKIAMEKKYG